MKPLYHFGLSQEDPISEIQALDLNDGDSLLCICSAGEIPLNMAALKDVTIVAVDVSENQLRLARLKRRAAADLPSSEAADFLGYREMDGAGREAIFLRKIKKSLSKEDGDFWQGNLPAIRKGVIQAGKFERYMNLASRPARMIIGKKNFYRLFECQTIAEQERVFDRYFYGPVLKGIFKLAFHPRIYQNRGIDQKGLQHHRRGNVGDLFFARFRSFCCSTPARDNFLLQYIFFGKSLFPNAIPEYLKPENRERFLKNQVAVRFVCSTMEKYISETGTGRFNKIQLSNIGDWLTREQMASLFTHIAEKCHPGSRIVLRYIYLEHTVPATVPQLKPDRDKGEIILSTDRFPFSSIVPIQHIDYE